ncbi:esterase-like activity of phytase family protein [Catellatospora paridis]|uniref:esterase-like activity of phytase family protein n=1 Tax=Catellatospora paridis TaxID=1617086 RepID=UPI0012D396A5|nr:esterase-like activity of phytase family protein [Catellatospora paridis]
MSFPTRAIAGAGAAGLAAALLLSGGPTQAADSPQTFSRTATFPVYLNTSAADAASAEISAVSADGKTVIYTDASGDRIGFVNIADPDAPAPAGVLGLPGSPTSVAVLGEYALVAVSTGADFTHPDGELLVVDVATRSVKRSIDLGGQPDSVAVSPDGRFVAVAIENERDEDVDDGEIPQEPAGWLSVVDVKPAVADWALRTVALTGLAEVAPTDPEPEYVSINSAGKAVVSLQENNHLAIVDLATGKVDKHFSAGQVTVSAVDTEDDDRISLTGSITARREPDGVVWLGTDRFATANEGDYQGGSRGWTVFDTTGKVVFDAGNSLEHLAVTHGIYPDKRSDAKGVEPENVATGVFGGKPYLFVNAERGNFTAVYEVTDPAHPKFVQLIPTANEPEGVIAVPSRGLVVISSELDDPDNGLRGAVTIAKFGQAPAYPSLVSAKSGGLPIAWGALSGLTPATGEPAKLWGVSDSVYAPTRLFAIDTAATPAVITKDVTVTKDGEGVALDAEGLATRPGGGFWLAVEGAKGPENKLVRIDAAGAVQQEVPLPADITAKLGSNGLEGVAVTGSGATETVWVAVQRELTGEKGTARIGRYRVTEGDWAWLGYPLDAAQTGAWIGLSELVALDADTFAVIERDNQRGELAKLKKVYTFDVPATLGAGVNPVTKKLAVDVLPALRAGHGWTQDKLEGLTVGGDGNVYAVTDNDGIDDATGETVFLRLGKANTVFPGVFPPADGGEGGGLPVTGAKVTTLVGIGLLVLALGAGLFRLARRRRPAV